MNEDVGRNDPCPCGSGKKYKKCCLVDHPPNRSSHERDEHETVRDKSPDETIDCSWKTDLKRFRSMQVQDKFEFLRERYRNRDEIGGDYFLELMTDLFRATARRGTHTAFHDLLENIHEHRRDLVDEFGAWLDHWWILSVLWSDDPITDRDLDHPKEDVSNENMEMHELPRSSP